MTGCALGTDVCHWMFKTKVNMVQGQEDGPLNAHNNSTQFLLSIKVTRKKCITKVWPSC